MKFLFVANFLRDEYSGAGGNIIRLIRALNQKGQIASCFFRDDMIIDIKRNILLHIIVFLLFPLIAALKILYADIKHHYDFIIISSGDGFLYALFAKLITHKRKPVIIMRSHGYEILYKREYEAERRIVKKSYFTSREKIFLYGFRLFQVRLFSHLCAGILSLTNGEKKHLEKLYPKKKIFVVPIGMEPLFLSQTEASRDRDVLFVGGWNILKGRVYLVDIITRLEKAIENLTVSIIGTRLCEDDVLVDFPEEMKSRIRVLRFLPREMLRREYLSHKIFLFPSLFEGYGNVILEAMASGMAVVVSKGLGAAEIIKNGYNGFLVEKRDVDGFVKTITAILKDAAFKSEIGRNAQKTVSHMTWDKAADILIKTVKGFNGQI